MKNSERLEQNKKKDLRLFRTAVGVENLRGR